MATLTRATTTHYDRPITTPQNMLRTLEHVAARFGTAPPVNVHRIDEALAAEPTTAQVVQAAAAESLTTTDPAAWLDDLVAAYTRAQAVEGVRHSLNGRRDALARAKASELLAALAPALRKRAGTVVTRLTAAAAKLPEGVRAFDAEAVIAADVAAERTAAAAALSDLAALSSVYETTAPTNGVPPSLHKVLPIVEVPEVDPERVRRLTRATANPSPVRDAVRALARDLDVHGTDVALVGVARGEYEGVSIAWASDRAELAERNARAQAAFMQRAVDVDGKALVAR